VIVLMLQCVAVCCRDIDVVVMEICDCIDVAVCCSVLQYVAVILVW